MFKCIETTHANNEVAVIGTTQVIDWRQKTSICVYYFWSTTSTINDKD